MKKLMTALQFLTIIPVGNNTVLKDSDIAKSSSFFVLVGLVQGLLLVATGYMAGNFFPADLVAGIILFMFVLSNGGFHLDGLADTFDAIASRGSREKKLSIMKDSTIGPIGVTAIVFSLLLKFLAFKNISFSSSVILYSPLLLMPVVSKWAMVVSMFHGKPAREDGLGNIFMNGTGLKEIAVSTLMLFIVLMSLRIFFIHSLSNSQNMMYIISVVCIYLVCRISIYFFSKSFGGLTGDTLGAISEISEITFLLWVTAWTQLSI
jgi:adenosylcobinamide-GDP ribazoletransferase